MIVTLCLGQTCVGAFLETPGTASGVFEVVSPEGIGENYDASAYDASGYAVAPNNVAVRQAYLKNLEGIPGKIDTTLPLRGQAMQTFNLRKFQSAPPVKGAMATL